MKRIVNGLLYDTDESELVYNDTETQRLLYRTKKGNFFTLYKNGEIIPKTKENVKEFIGTVDVNMYIKLFGEPEEA